MPDLTWSLKKKGKISFSIVLFSPPGRGGGSSVMFAAEIRSADNRGVSDTRRKWQTSSCKLSTSPDDMTQSTNVQRHEQNFIVRSIAQTDSPSRRPPKPNVTDHQLKFVPATRGCFPTQ